MTLRSISNKLIFFIKKTSNSNQQPLDELYPAIKIWQKGYSKSMFNLFAHLFECNSIKECCKIVVNETDKWSWVNKYFCWYLNCKLSNAIPRCIFCSYRWVFYSWSKTLTKYLLLIFKLENYTCTLIKHDKSDEEITLDNIIS